MISSVTVHIYIYIYVCVCVCVVCVCVSECVYVCVYVHRPITITIDACPESAHPILAHHCVIHPSSLIKVHKRRRPRRE